MRWGRIYGLLLLLAVQLATGTEDALEGAASRQRNEVSGRARGTFYCVLARTELLRWQLELWCDKATEREGSPTDRLGRGRRKVHGG